MTKQIILMSLATLLATPALAAEPAAGEKKCCCDKMKAEGAATDHGAMGHSTPAPK
ncbi:hypothetical protein [Sandaracinobacteroides hominis]|uniref:hypothetical protein n=1 Tax=Sandaracinobacteroides hominis TaxID=2780086 RepID=UPI0018F5F180|nr:hypothetical protein [Sandaracinobacteroides hominis]